MRPQRDAAKLFAALIAVLLASAACVHAKEPGVGIKALESDVVFGVKEVAKQTTPANTGGQIDATSFTEDVALPPIKSTLRKQKAVVPCPPARANAFPSEPAEFNVPLDPAYRLPREGTYRWKKSGAVSVPNLGALRVSGFEERRIQNVHLTAEDDAVEVAGTVVKNRGITFTYDTVQPDLSNRPVTTSWRVRTNATAAFQDLPVDPTGGQSGKIIVGEPDRGLVIQKIVTAPDERGGTFQPLFGVLVLPLRVQTGETWNSVGIDPATLQALTLQGRVIGPERIDACGDVIEGYRVEATMTSTTDNVPVTYNYIVNPNDGAVLISETIKRETAAGPIDVTFTLGQKNPDPLSGAAS